MSAALVGRGIRVNALCPGMMKTEMQNTMLTETAESLAYIEELRAKYIPMGRGAMPEEVAEAALFLASDDSGYMLGGEIIVDGGVSMVR
jgi:NAD(P)-dependent dehydrogenase (short-subunit alcohol dehydrogenase family)